MAKFMELMRKWFDAGEEETAEPVAEEVYDPVPELEAALNRCRQERELDAALAEMLAEQTEQALEARHVWIFAFDRETGEQLLGHRAGGGLEKALCPGGEPLAEALARHSGESLELFLDGQWRLLRLEAHRWAKNVIYTVLDVTQTNQLLQEQQEAQQRDPITGLYTWEAFLREGGTLLDSQIQTCVVHMRTLLRESLVGIGSTGTPEAFIRAWAEVVRTLPCHGIFARAEKGTLCGVLYDYDPQQLTQILQQLHKALEEKTWLLEPAGVNCHGVILGSAQYPEDHKNLQGLLLRARLSAYLATGQGKEGHCPYAGDRAVPGYLLRGEAAFRKLVADPQAGILIQPVVRADNAKIEGYALSLEPREPGLDGMGPMAEVAEFLGCTQDLERLMWFRGMERVKQLIKSGKLLYNTTLWIPSFPGSYLPDQEGNRFEECYFDFMPYLVSQLDAGREDLLCADIKGRRVRRWGARTELRCSGLDRTTSLSLTLLQPELIRVDGALVAGIGTDKEKQAAFKALKSWAAANGSKLLAEGICSTADLKTVVKLGADFLQGECLGRPEAGPADIPENRIAQIGEARYGKRSQMI